MSPSFDQAPPRLRSTIWRWPSRFSGPDGALRRGVPISSVSRYPARTVSAPEGQPSSFASASAGESAGADAFKGRMRALARAYAAGLPALDTHSLMEGRLLQHAGVRLEFMPMGDRDGAYDPENKVILINSQVRPERQRFTLAHEISHALLLSDDDLLSDLHDSYEGERLETMIETLCNVGAAGLLIPDALMNDILEKHGPSGRAMAELVRRADVSGSAALYALSEVARGQVLLAVCAPSGRGEARQLTVRVSGKAAGVKYRPESRDPGARRAPYSDRLRNWPGDQRPQLRAVSVGAQDARLGGRVPRRQRAAGVCQLRP